MVCDLIPPTLTKIAADEPTRLLFCVINPLMPGGNKKVTHT